MLFILNWDNMNILQDKNQSKNNETICNETICDLLNINSTEEYDKKWYEKIEQDFYSIFPEGIKEDPEYFFYF